MSIDLDSPMILLGLPFYEMGEDRLKGILQKAYEEHSSLWLNLVTQDHLQGVENDLELRRDLITADILIPESWLLVSACKQLFHSPLTLYSAPTLLTAAIDAGPPTKRTTVLLPQGDCPNQLLASWSQRFPHEKPPTILSVPTDLWMGDQSAQFLGTVIETMPNLLVLFLPTPLQEKWIGSYHRYLNSSIIVGLGPCDEMAPVALIPGRTQDRLRHSKTQLLKRIADQSQRLAVDPAAPRHVPRAPLRDHLNSRWSEMSIRGRFDASQVDALGKSLTAILIGGSSLLLDLSQVSFIDSSALGLLVSLLKTAEQVERQLILIRPTKVVTDALKLVQLNELFDVAADSDSARIRGDLMARNGHIRFERGPEPNTARIFWRGRIHAANWEKFWRDTHQVIQDVQRLSCTPRDIRFQLDLGQISFIDSLGVGLLLRLMKWAREQLVLVNVVNPSEAVRQVIDLAKLRNPLLPDNHLPLPPTAR